MEKFLLAVIQLDTQDEVSSNLQQASHWIAEAAKNGAKMVVFPETMDYIGAHLAAQAKERTDMVAQTLQQLAAKHQVYLSGGSITEYNPAGKPYNTTFVFSPSGTLLCKYRKLHMFDIQLRAGTSYCESAQIHAGSEIVLARTPLVTAGFAICYDIRFPELFRLMALHGAQLFCVSANFTLQTGKDHWETLLRARAIENTCYIAAAGQTGTKPSFPAYGHSMIIDPWGNILAQAGDAPGYCMAEIDLAYTQQVREQLPSLQNIRKDVYQLNTSHLRCYTEP